MDFEIKAYLANVALNPDEVIDKKCGPPVAETRFQTQINVCLTKVFLLSFFLSFRDTCRLMIRKIQYAPANNKEGPKTEISKQFMMNDKPVQLEASLGKEARQAATALKSKGDVFPPSIF